MLRRFITAALTFAEIMIVCYSAVALVIAMVWFLKWSHGITYYGN